MAMLPLSSQGTTQGKPEDDEATLDNGLTFKWGVLKNVTYDESHYEYIRFDTPFKEECKLATFSVGQRGYVEGGRFIYLISKNCDGLVVLPGFTSEVIKADLYWMAVGY